MKSRTSYCKLTTFKKDLTRFAPVWALYLIAMMMVLVEATAYGNYDHIGKNLMPDLVVAFGIVNICYAGLCALVLFGDLYNTRMCYSLHTQPARREHLFLSHAAAALCFSLVPNAVAAAFLMIRLESYWFLGLYWLLASTLQFIFFFGLASVSAMCAGNRLGMLAIYAVLNFFSMIAYWVVDTIYLPQMTGVVLNFETYSRLCPVVEMFESDYFQFKTIQSYNEHYFEYETFYEYTGLGTGWGYLAAIAGVGVAALALAVLLYRLRHLESAGDFVAFPKLSPVVGVVLTVCVAVACAFFGEIIGSSYMVWMFVGLVVGWFGSRMLLERRVKVFHGKSFLGLGALVAVLVASFLVISTDMLNIEGYLPEKDQVASVTVSNYKGGGNIYMEDYYYYSNRISVTLDKEEEIQDILEAHEDILNRLDRPQNGSSHRVTISYKLKSGRTVVRSYVAPANGTNYEIFTKYFYTPQQILGYEDWDEYVKSVTYIDFGGMDLMQENYEQMLLALRTDCENGTVGTSGNIKEADYWVYIQVEKPDGTRYNRELAVTDRAYNTLAVLKEKRVMLGFETVEEVLGTHFMTIMGMEVEPEERMEILEMLLKDFENGGVVAGDRSFGGYYVEYNIQTKYGECYRYLGLNKHAENTFAWIEAHE